MSIGYEILNAFERAGKAIGKAVESAAGKTKASYTIYMAENELEKLYTELGKAASQGEDTGDLKEKIEEQKARVEKLRAQRNVSTAAPKTCERCGANNSEDNEFCPKCGNKL